MMASRIAIAPKAMAIINVGCFGGVNFIIWILSFIENEYLTARRTSP
jgi:hypothetical protein